MKQATATEDFDVHISSETIGSNSASVMDMCREFCLRDELITRPEEFYRLCGASLCVI